MAQPGCESIDVGANMDVDTCCSMLHDPEQVCWAIRRQIATVCLCRHLTNWARQCLQAIPFSNASLKIWFIIFYVKLQNSNTQDEQEGLTNMPGAFSCQNFCLQWNDTRLTHLPSIHFTNKNVTTKLKTFLAMVVNIASSYKYLEGSRAKGVRNNRPHRVPVLGNFSVQE